MEILAVILIFTGLVFDFGGTIGILRLPDVYTRLHMAGKLDTLGSMCLLLGLAVVNATQMGTADLFVSGKILLILVLVFIASPTATHSMVDAGVWLGLTPWRKGDPRR